MLSLRFVSFRDEIIWAENFVNLGSILRNTKTLAEVTVSWTGRFTVLRALLIRHLDLGFASKPGGWDYLKYWSRRSTDGGPWWTLLRSCWWGISAASQNLFMLDQVLLQHHIQRLHRFRELPSAARRWCCWCIGLVTSKAIWVGS